MHFDFAFFFQVEKNDRKTEKICQNCFDKLNEFDRLRESCAAANIYLGSEAAADTQSKWSVNSSLGVEGLSHATETYTPNEIRCGQRHSFDFRSVRSHQHSHPIPGTVESPQSLQSRTVSDAIDPDYTSNTESAGIGLHLTVHVGYVSLLYKTYTSSGEMSNNSPNNNTLPQKDNACRISNEAHQSNALNELPMMYISSSEEDEMESSVANAHAIKKRGQQKTAKRRAARSVECFTVTCGFLKCREKLDAGEGLNYHIETYHARRVREEISCYLCNRRFRLMRALRKHFNSVHSDHLLFTCSVGTCSKNFTRRFNLKLHENAVHTKNVVYQSTKCDYKSYYKSNARRHCTFSHGKEESNGAGHDKSSDVQIPNTNTQDDPKMNKLKNNQNIYYKCIRRMRSSSQ